MIEVSEIIVMLIVLVFFIFTLLIFRRILELKKE
jgi:hypothetical protein